MTFRELFLQYPQASLKNWIAERECVVRLQATEYRGPLCITGDGRAWAVCELVDCVPSTHPKGEDGAPAHYCWHLANLRVLPEPIDYRAAGYDDLWESPRGPEPQMCGAWLQQQLNRMFSEPEAPVIVEPVIVPEPIISDEPFVPASVSERGQLAMF